MESKNLPIGTTLQSGKYTVEQIIGDGGFGITYYVRHNVLGHYFAIKEFFISGYCIRNPQSHDVNPQRITETAYEKYLRKFIEEAQILAKLDHPNIVKVTDIFQENNTAYMVMPFVNGKTLQQIVNEKGRLGYEKAVNYVAQLSDAINYIHQRDILHRDIKPDNVIITGNDKAILIDFGSAREFIPDKAQQQHTAIYTQGYAPLEQYSSEGKKGTYSDIYSLGAVFYFTLTGQKPMDASIRTMEKMQEPQALVSSIPDEANRTIVKAMQLNPENRYQNIKEFMEDLLNKKKPNQKNKKKPARVYRLLIGFLSGIFLVLLVIIAGEQMGYYKNDSGRTAVTLPEEEQAESTIDSVKDIAPIADDRKINADSSTIAEKLAIKPPLNDSIRGDFDGNGVSEYMWLGRDSTHIGGNSVCFIKFSDPKIPPIEVENCTGGRLFNEGDLNKNKSDEVGFLADSLSSCWKTYYVWTFIAGQWVEAVDPIPTHCVQWERNIKAIEIDKNVEGNVIVTYTEVNDSGDFVINSKSVKIRKE